MSLYMTQDTLDAFPHIIPAATVLRIMSDLVFSAYQHLLIQLCVRYGYHPWLIGRETGMEKLDNLIVCLTTVHFSPVGWEKPELREVKQFSQRHARSVRNGTKTHYSSLYNPISIFSVSTMTTLICKAASIL